MNGKESSERLIVVGMRKKRFPLKKSPPNAPKRRKGDAMKGTIDTVYYLLSCFPPCQEEAEKKKAAMTRIISPLLVQVQVIC